MPPGAVHLLNAVVKSFYGSAEEGFIQRFTIFGGRNSRILYLIFNVVFFTHRLIFEDTSSSKSFNLQLTLTSCAPVPPHSLPSLPLPSIPLSQLTIRPLPPLPSSQRFSLVSPLLLPLPLSHPLTIACSVDGVGFKRRRWFACCRH